MRAYNTTNRALPAASTAAGWLKCIVPSVNVHHSLLSVTSFLSSLVAQLYCRTGFKIIAYLLTHTHTHPTVILGYSLFPILQNFPYLPGPCSSPADSWNMAFQYIHNIHIPGAKGEVERNFQHHHSVGMALNMVSAALRLT